VATANTALVRTAQRLSVSVRAYLPPHNFTVSPQRSGSVSFRVGRRFAPNCRGSVLLALGQPEKSQALLSEPQRSSSDRFGSAVRGSERCRGAIAERYQYGEMRGDRPFLQRISPDISAIATRFPSFQPHLQVAVFCQKRRREQIRRRVFYPLGIGCCSSLQHPQPEKFFYILAQDVAF
jgi:hypothetical protein